MTQDVGKVLGLLGVTTILLFGPTVPTARAATAVSVCVKQNGLMYVIGGGFQKADCKPNDQIFSFGLSGSDGPTGATGQQGPIGATGMQGEMGPVGATGSTGLPGPIGATGADGEVGPQGPSGETGPSGATGPIGAQGESGATGVMGATGPAGGEGPIGSTGEIGPTGPSGSGETGATGVEGPMGSTGPVGETGANGISGWEKIVGTLSSDDELQKTVTADCTLGKKVIGGGFLTESRSDSGEIAIALNGPIDDDTWQVVAGVDATSGGDESFAIQAVVICANTF